MRRRRRSRAVVKIIAVAVALGIFGASPAYGQDGGGAGGTGGASADVKQLYRDGMEAAKRKDWAKSRELLEKAFKRQKNWKIAVNLGRAEAKLGMHRDAAEHLEYFLTHTGAGDVSKGDRATAEALLNQTRKKVATVTVTVNVDGAEVTAGGNAVGKTPLPGRVFLEPGQSVIVAKREGYETATQTVDLKAGATETVTLEMKASKEDVRAAQGKGGSNGEGDGNAEGGGDGKSPAWHPWAMGIGFGLAAVGVGVGVGFLVAGNAKDAQGLEHIDSLKFRTPSNTTVCAQGLQDQQVWRAQECQNLNSLIASRDTFHTVSIVGFAAGGAAAAAALIIALLPTSSSSTERDAGVRIVPSISARSGNVIVTGVF